MAALWGRRAQKTFRSTAVNSTILRSLRPASPFDPDIHIDSSDGTTISAYGSLYTWSQTNLDGITMVKNRSAYANLYPSVDAIQEFKVYTGNAELNMAVAPRR